MKKLFFIISLFLINKSDAQFQSMSILPEAMRSASFNSLCLNLFADAPTSSTVYDLPGGTTIRGRGLKGDYRHMNISGSESSLSGEEPTFVVPRGNKNEAVEPRLKEFVTRKISEYNTPEFSTSTVRQRELQNEVWAYNVLETTGYLSHESDVISDFHNGIKKFKRDYGINDSGVSEIVDIGDTEHALRKTNLAFDIQDSYVILKNRETDRSYRYKLIHYNLDYKGEKNIISRNKKAIIGAIELQAVKDPDNMGLEILPNNYHTKHIFIIHVRGQADISRTLFDNNHAAINLH
jgi:hypothetical protein